MQLAHHAVLDVVSLVRSLKAIPTCAMQIQGLHFHTYKKTHDSLQGIRPRLIKKRVSTWPLLLCGSFLFYLGGRLFFTRKETQNLRLHSVIAREVGHEVQRDAGLSCQHSEPNSSDLQTSPNSQLVSRVHFFWPVALRHACFRRH